jgi:DNA-binding transcriptional regulator GbsR (MarR family)
MTDSWGEPRDSEAVRRFIERFGAVLVDAGFAPMAARVFAALLTTDSGQLTGAELRTILSASAAAISGAVRYLMQLGLVRKEREPGSRRDVYHVVSDIWYEAAVRRDQVLSRWVSTASEGIEVLGSQTPAGQRMAESVDFFIFLQQEMPLVLERWRAHQRRLKAAAAAPAGD